MFCCWKGGVGDMEVDGFLGGRGDEGGEGMN